MAAANTRPISRGVLFIFISPNATRGGALYVVCEVTWCTAEHPFNAVCDTGVATIERGSKKIKDQVDYVGGYLCLQ
jgi:hypothetical protein